MRRGSYSAESRFETGGLHEGMNMGMSMHCLAVKPADAEYMKKLAAYRACVIAHISVPQELVDFFGGEDPDEEGATITLAGYRSEHVSCEEWSDDGRTGFQVDITKLPEGTRFVRFYCSW